MGWVSLALIGVAAMAGVVALRLPRALWTLVAAALMLGAAGYAWQGRPSTPAQPANAAARVFAEDPAIIDLREQMFGRFSADGAYLTAADAMMRAGERQAAVQVILGGIRAIPRSAMLWTGLGSALAVHDGNRLSPPAVFAFQQAARLAPRQPGPPFFEGLAEVRAGDLTAAQAAWTRALRLSPERRSYRGEIATRLALLSRVLAPQNQPRPDVGNTSD